MPTTRRRTPSITQSASGPGRVPARADVESEYQRSIERSTAASREPFRNCWLPKSSSAATCASGRPAWANSSPQSASSAADCLTRPTYLRGPAWIDARRVEFAASFRRADDGGHNSSSTAARAIRAIQRRVRCRAGTGGTAPAAHALRTHRSSERLDGVTLRHGVRCEETGGVLPHARSVAASMMRHISATTRGPDRRRDESSDARARRRRRRR